jgi:hypothetical protein
MDRLADALELGELGLECGELAEQRVHASALGIGAAIELRGFLHRALLARGLRLLAELIPGIACRHHRLRHLGLALFDLGAQPGDLGGIGERWLVDERRGIAAGSSRSPGIAVVAAAALAAALAARDRGSRPARRGGARR